MAGREKLLGAIGVVTTGLGLALLLVPGLIGTLGPIGLVIEAVDAFGFFLLNVNYQLKRKHTG
jgi:hypothetical protein